ncbi:hypothetical protein [uncultured Pseudacidovorax sp.]|uniref:gp53-like domain-containing protein n=1 Tax=uncultured Pseudacidovorax sp. TaxID=679313 RepID=UPI0025F0A7FA|nr:hypothetical protein [uncultured Pseudacidovorax sp.]
MKRITTSTAVPNMFGVGKPGFRDGNLSTGVAPTDFAALWFNHVQEEISRVIEAAGLTLDENNFSQLLAALSRTGVFYTPATDDNSTRAATTAFVRNVCAALLSTAGYQKLPSGLIMQWGISGAVASGGFAAITLPIAFPTGGIASLATWQQDTTGTSGNVVAAGWPTATTITVYNRATTESVIRWMALGY